MNNKLIYYVGPFDFPHGGAAAKRILGNIHSLDNNKVIVIDGKSINKKDIFQGIEVISCSERPNKSDNFLRKLIKYFNISKNTISYIEKQKKLPDVIILYSGYSPYLLRLIPFCKKNKIKLVFDCVEWYQPKNTIEYCYNFYYWNIEFAMRYLITKCDSIICISEYLSNYYEKKGNQTVIIPPTINDIGEPKILSKESTKIKLVYAGNPGHKDLLDYIIDVVSEFEDKFELHIVGINGNNCKSIIYYGIVSQQKAQSIVAECDFSVLLRADNKVSRAGFSTKIVESLSVGTPVVANQTGDIHKYVKNGVNGFIVSDQSKVALRKTLVQVYSIDPNSYRKMSMEACMTSKQFFHVDAYRNIINKVIN